MSDKEISASEFEEIFNDEARHEEHDQQLNDISECSNGGCFMDTDTEDVADEDVEFDEDEFDDEELEEGILRVSLWTSWKMMMWKRRTMISCFNKKVHDGIYQI